MAIIKYKDKDGKLQPLGATGDHSHSLESLGAAAKDHPHDVVSTDADGFMSVADKTALDGAVENISKLQMLVGNDNVPVSEKIADAVNTAMAIASKEDESISGRLSVVETDYLVAQDKSDLQAEIAAAEESAVDRVLGYAEGDTVSTNFDTLKKVADWIESDIDKSEKLTGRVSAIEGDHLTSEDKDELDGKIAKNSGDITTLNGQVANKVEQSDFDTWTAKMPTSGTVPELVASAIEGLAKELNVEQYATNTALGEATDRISELEKLPQKNATTSDSGFMSADDKEKLDGIADNANKYEHVTYSSATSGLYNITVDSEGHVSATSQVKKSDITNLGIPEKNTEYENADTDNAGLMSATDKKALDNLSSWVTGSVSEAISEAIEKHGHNYAKSDSDGGAADAAKKVSNSLIVKLNGGTVEDNTMFTFNGSAAKTINIQPSNIGAAPNSNFKGASITQAGTAGLVPAPTTGTTGKFLKSDGTWGTPPNDNTTYSAGTGISISTDNKISNSGVRSVSAGSTNGTISVNTGGKSTEVSVAGLGSAAYTDSGQYESSGAAAEALAAANKYTDDAIDDITPDSIGAATSGHNHDSTYSKSGHTHDYASSTHNHDSTYSKSGHTHDYAAASHGNHVPTTETANNAKFLRNDNSWQTVTPANIGALTATTISSGTFNDIKKPGIYAIFNINTHAPTTYNYWTLIVGTSTNQSGNYVHQIAICENTCDMYIRSLYSSSWSSWVKIRPDVMTGATSSAAGSSGLVPQPAKGNQDKFLKGDGTWATPSTTYTLPVASDTTLGGVKVGSGLSISDGVLSATGGGVPDMLYSGNTTSKLYLIGAISQTTQGAYIYSNQHCYAQNNHLYSNGSQVLTQGSIQSATSGIMNVPAKGSNVIQLSFSPSYSTAPKVVATIQGNMDAANVGVSIVNTNADFFTAKIWNNTPDPLNVYFNWIAIGTPS